MFSFYHRGYFRFHVSFWWCRKKHGAYVASRQGLLKSLAPKLIITTSQENKTHHVAQIFSLPADVVECSCKFVYNFFLQKAAHHPKVKRHHTSGYTPGATSLGGCSIKRSTRWALPVINGVTTVITLNKLIKCLINRFHWGEITPFFSGVVTTLLVTDFLGPTLVPPSDLMFQVLHQHRLELTSEFGKYDHGNSK